MLRHYKLQYLCMLAELYGTNRDINSDGIDERYTVLLCVKYCMAEARRGSFFRKCVPLLVLVYQRPSGAMENTRREIYAGTWLVTQH